MKFNEWSGSTILMFAATFMLSSAGCGNEDRNTAVKDSRVTATKAGGKDHKEDGKNELAANTKHDGWWCQEHGVPEHLCSLCSDEVAAKLKKEGDWCKIHDRAKSQCFKCDPDLYKKYEAMYVAKYNKKPEPPPREEFEK